MRTKIIATIGPASFGKKVLTGLVEAGVYIFRLNFSHGSAEDFVDLIKLIREIEAEYGLPLTIMQDLAGPKIRIGEIESGSIQVNKGQRLLLGIRESDTRKDEGVQPTPSTPCEDTPEPELPYLPFDHQAVLSSLEEGDLLALADGALTLRVKKKITNELFVIKALNSGIITSRKGLALPGKSVKLAALTEVDRRNLKAGLLLGVDAVALSYVQTPEDVREARELIHQQGYNIPIIAKLERRNAVENLNEILEEADIIMVARGDLGVECPLEELPAMQKRIILACNKASKPVIVATQMLLSMVNSPTPTRAEVTDVANAVLDGTDCVMLSEETAMGNYPVETVEYMHRITTSAEKLLWEEDISSEPPTDSDTAEFLAYSACLLAKKSKASALVAHSTSGTTARLLSVRQPEAPIYALTLSPRVLHNLNFCWGVTPCLLEEDESTHLERVERFIETHAAFTRDEVFVITAGQPKVGYGSVKTNLVKIYNK